MEKTEKLGLWLPADTDPLEIAKLNENSEKIDEFAADAGSAFKVGDILTTWRTDLGDNWLLCNGGWFDPAVFPKLAEITPGLPTMAELRVSNHLYEHNATISSAANNYATDGAKHAIIGSAGVLVSTNAFGTATHITPLSINFASFPSSMIFYVNNKWIIAKQTAGELISFLVADDPEGEWTEVPLTNMNICVQHMEYLNGSYWVFGANMVTASASTYAYTKALFGHFSDFSITGFPLTEINMCSMTNNAYWTHFVRADDRFWFFAWPSAQIGNPTIYFTSTDSPDSPWSEPAAVGLPNSTLINAVNWVNGKLVFTCNVYVYCFENNEFRLMTYAPILDSGAVKHVTSVQFVRGFYVYACYDKLIMFMDGMPSWYFPIENTIKTMKANKITATTGEQANYPPPVPSAAIFAGNTFLCFGLNGDDKTIGVNRVFEYAVPKISLPQSYTYIKAKE